MSAHIPIMKDAVQPVKMCYFHIWGVKYAIEFNDLVFLWIKLCVYVKETIDTSYINAFLFEYK